MPWFSLLAFLLSVRPFILAVLCQIYIRAAWDFHLTKHILRRIFTMSLGATEEQSGVLFSARPQSLGMFN